MPRDGSGNYTVPAGTDGVPDATISSAKYNGYIHDVETDLNTARPIVAGGTGASSAAGARTSLQAERAMQIITNFDSAVLENGSFYAAPGATGAPVAGHPFIGIVYGDPLNSITVEARDVDATATVRDVYTRTRISGAWSAWIKHEVYTPSGNIAANTVTGAIAELDSEKVARSGDTMSGDLQIIKATPTLYLNKTASTQNVSILGQTGAGSRWAILLGDGTIEGGSDSGSNFAIWRYADGGSSSIALGIARNTGLVTVAADPTAPLGVATKQYADTAASTAASARVAKAGDTMSGDLGISKASPAIVLTKSASTQNAGVYGSTGAGTRWFMALGNGTIEGGSDSGSDFAINRYNDAGTYISTPFSIARSTGYTTVNTLYNNNVSDRWGNPTGALVVSTQGYKPAGGSWADSSDSRIKNVVGPYEHGLAELLQVNPVRYTFKGNVTTLNPEDVPENLKKDAVSDHSAVLGKEFIGVVAQQIEQPMPETVTQTTGWIDGQQVDDLRILDASALTYALINAVKTLAARVEALETAQAAPP